MYSLSRCCSSLPLPHCKTLMQGSARLLATLSAVLLALSLTPKVLYYANFDAKRQSFGEPRVMTFFARHGWTLVSTRDLTADGSPRALRFSGLDCQEGADVVVV